MLDNSNKPADLASRVQPFREDGTFRLPTDLAPGRFRPFGAYRIPKPTENFIEFLKQRKAPDEAATDRGRQLAITGDPLADDYAVLYKDLGYDKARGMLDAALEHGIENVPDAPPALKALFAEVDRVPEWVNWKRVERGAEIMRRYAPITWLFRRLAFAQTYVNANAGMPLYMTGSLGYETVSKRLKETDRWRLGIQQPGALRRNGDGFKTVVRVRVLHGIIRHHILRSGKWDVERLGMPIPQIDMAGANVGMMLTHSQLLSSLGILLTPGEMRDVTHFWRYHGYLVGVTDELNPKSAKDLKRINDLIAVTIRQALDPRGRTLTQSTLNAQLHGDDSLSKLLDYVDVRVSHALYLILNGSHIYNAMQLGTERRWLWFFPTVFPAVFATHNALRFVPGAKKLAAKLGSRYISSVMEIDEVKNAPFKPYANRNKADGQSGATANVSHGKVRHNAA